MKKMKCILLWCILWRLIDHLGYVCVFGGDPDFFFLFAIHHPWFIEKEDRKKRTEPGTTFFYHFCVSILPFENKKEIFQPS